MHAFCLASDTVCCLRLGLPLVLYIACYLSLLSAGSVHHGYPLHQSSCPHLGPSVETALASFDAETGLERSARRDGQKNGSADWSWAILGDGFACIRGTKRSPSAGGNSVGRCRDKSWSLIGGPLQEVSQSIVMDTSHRWCPVADGPGFDKQYERQQELLARVVEPRVA